MGLGVSPSGAAPALDDVKRFLAEGDSVQTESILFAPTIEALTRYAQALGKQLAITLTDRAS